MNRQQTLSNVLSLALVLGATLTLFVLVIQTASATPSPLTPGNPAPYPEPNTHTFPATTTVSITYDEPISPTTVSTQTFAVHARQTGLLTQTYGVDEGTVALTPTQLFHAGELVQVSATTATLSLIDGTGPLSPTVWQFHVAVLNGSGFFTATLPTLDISWTQDVALGDLDGDGDLDAFVAAVASNTVWLNDGTGVFVDSGQGLGIADSEDVALGDVDGDGALDAFVANDTYPGSPNKIWLNDGYGVFDDNGQDLGDAASKGVALGDLDGDSDLDAFVVNDESQGNRVWLNDGGIQGGAPGLFSDSGQELGNSPSFDVALGDLDSDGDLDAFVGNMETNTVWLNDGRGFFVDSGQSLVDFQSYGVALGDVDGDGDLDAFVANTYWFTPSNKVWLNDGNGFFDDSGQELGDSVSLAVALGDVDADGDLDACVANGDQTTEVWLNDGTGVFVDSGQGLGQASWYVELGDVDGDGDLDVYTAGGGGLEAAVMSGGDQVWLNLSPPQATDDAYVTDVNTPLTVAAPGVLGNDNDPDSEDLVVQVDLGPGHGALVLTPDGAFVYTPTLDFTGVDTYTYLASDGVLTDVAQVRITVAEPISGLVVVNDSPTVLGDTTTFTATVAAGSDVTYTWDLGDGTIGQYVGVVHGDEVSRQEEASEPFVLTHVYPAVGVYTAIFTASNSLGETAATTTVTLTDIPIDGLEVLSDSPTVLGNPTTLTATVAAGSNVTYTWAFGDGEVGSGAVVTHTYPGVGVYTAVVTASNSVGLLTATTTVEIARPTIYIYLPLVLRE
jgi:hypothetical protein